MPLPLPLAEPVLRPCAEQRGDTAWVTARWQDPRALVVQLHGDRVLLDDAGAVAWHPPATAEPPQGADWAFLGIDADERPRFAVAAADAGGHDRAVRSVGIADPWSPDLRMVVTGLALLTWHRRHPRCPLCGEPTRLEQAGWVRRCPADDSQHFPRVDPAVIMLVTDGADRALLGRQARWPQSWFSTLAGFVEPGETLENAVVREVEEEVGVAVGRVTYRGSQPWPFPNSLMLGFTATATATDVVCDQTEIAEARWFTRAELAEGCTARQVRLPPRFSVSRWLIEDWYGAELPGDWSRE